MVVMSCLVKFWQVWTWSNVSSPMHRTTFLAGRVQKLSWGTVAYFQISHHLIQNLPCSDIGWKPRLSPLRGSFVRIQLWGDVFIIRCIFCCHFSSIYLSLAISSQRCTLNLASVHQLYLILLISPPKSSQLCHLTLEFTIQSSIAPVTFSSPPLAFFSFFAVPNNGWLPL